MALSRRQIEDFLFGKSVPENVEAEILQQIDIPGSLVRRIVQEWGIATQAAFDPEGILPGETLSNIERAHQELLKEAISALRKGDLAAADSISAQALTDAINNFADDHPLLASSFGCRGRILNVLGKRGEAIEQFQRAIAIAERLPAQPKTATLYNDFAVVLNDVGRYVEAEEYHLRALRLRKEWFGNEHVEVAQSLQNLGLVYSNSRDYIAAENMLHEALAVWEATAGIHHHQTATTLGNLGTLYHKLYDLARAEECYRRALAIERDVLGDKHMSVAVDLTNLGIVLKDQQRFAEALDTLNEALEIRTASLGSNHPARANTLISIGGIWLTIGEFEKAQQAYEEVLSIMENHFGKEHAEYARGLGQLASVHRKLEDYQTAEDLYRQALDIQIRTLGSDSVEAARTWGNIAVLISDKGDLATAIECHSKALIIKREKLGDEHPETLITLNNLAIAYSQQGDWLKAYDTYHTVLLARRKVFGSEHQGYATTAAYMAIACSALGRVDEAYKLTQEAIEADELLLSQIFTLANVEQRKKTIRTVRRRMDHLLTLAMTHFREDRSILEHAFEHVVRRKSIVAEPASAERDLKLAVSYPDFALLIKERITLRRQLAIVKLEGVSIEEGATAIRARQWQARLREIDDVLQASISQERQWQLQHSAKAWMIAEHLDREMALAECVTYSPLDFDALRRENTPVWKDERYLAFVLDHRGDLSIIDLGLAQEIDTAIQQVGAPLVGTTAISEAAMERMRAPSILAFAGDAALASVSSEQVAALLGSHGRQQIITLQFGAQLIPAA